MSYDDLISQLGYDDSAYYLGPSRWPEYPGYSYYFRKAQQKFGLKGVYVLSDRGEGAAGAGSIVPVIYVCQAENEEEADMVHRAVWNQNMAPFVLVVSPRQFRIYKGFEYNIKTRSKQKEQDDQAILNALIDAGNVLESFSDFTADSIDQGVWWNKQAVNISSRNRVDWKLLLSLKQLGELLRKQHVPANVAHMLIGKYVYLRYLRDRDILSDRKFNEWNLAPADVFGRNARLDAFFDLDDKLNNWLNGSVFKIRNEFKQKFNQNHLQTVVDIFLGDKISGQMHLPFKAYDFAHIPIETLSVVYQQFLHAEGGGRSKGAYYTPIHLVNFMIDELDAKKPLQKGTRVFDGSAGSGAFLVQCYRRLIEREMAENEGKLPSPSELRELLTKHIYGLDRDPDACNIMELSLVLTLLDYVTPPDLERHRNFKLPVLRDHNVFHADFFGTNQAWESKRPARGYDWIIGNPPWKRLQGSEEDDNTALAWIAKNCELPVGNKQLAEAFCWKLSQHLAPEGVAGLLMPALTLFKEHSSSFRQVFFHKLNVWCIVNFSNLRKYLFHGADHPAAGFFFHALVGETSIMKSKILYYSPFAISQLIVDGDTNRTGKDMWSIIIDTNYLREIDAKEAAKGVGSTWKVAMWGTSRDKRLINKITRKFPSLRDFAQRYKLIGPHQGLDLKTADSKYNGVHVGELIGKKILIMKKVEGSDRLFSIPSIALRKIDGSEAYYRERSGKIGLDVSEPPHIIINESRNFAVYSDDFIVVPSTQLGISGPINQSKLLKVLALYFSSDFSLYYQSLSSTFWGIERDRFTKADLESLPIPLEALSNSEIEAWIHLFNRLSPTSDVQNKSSALSISPDNDELYSHINTLNELASRALNLTENEKVLVRDFIKYRRELNEGRFGINLVRNVLDDEIWTYASLFKSELDDFMGDETKLSHRIKITKNNNFATMQVMLVNNKNGNIEMENLSKSATEALGEKINLLLKKRRQWGYFKRCLRIYEGKTTYIFKPLQRIYWLKSQALIDADEFIADMLT